MITAASRSNASWQPVHHRRFAVGSPELAGEVQLVGQIFHCLLHARERGGAVQNAASRFSSMLRFEPFKRLVAPGSVIVVLDCQRGKCRGARAWRAALSGCCLCPPRASLRRRRRGPWPSRRGFMSMPSVSGALRIAMSEMTLNATHSHDHAPRRAVADRKEPYGEYGHGGRPRSDWHRCRASAEPE